MLRKLRYNETITCLPEHALGRARTTFVPSGSLFSALATFEKDFIIDALKNTRGNIAKAARLLDTSERILGLRVKKYGIQFKQFR